MHERDVPTPLPRHLPPLLPPPLRLCFPSACAAERGSAAPPSDPLHTAAVGSERDSFSRAVTPKGLRRASDISISP